MKNYKKTKNWYQLYLFLFSTDIDFKNNIRRYRKPFLKFLGGRIAEINLFQLDLDKP